MDGDWRNRNIRAKGMGDVRNRVGPRRGVNQGLNVNAQGPNILRAPNAGPSHHAFRFPQQTEKDPFDSDDDEPPTSHRSSRPSTSRPTTPSASIHHLSSLLHRTNLNSSRGYASQNSSTSSLPSLFSDRIQPNIRGRNSQHPNQRENRFGQQSVGSNRENGHNFPFGGRQRNSHHLNKGGNHGRGGKQNTRMGREDLNASSSSIPSLFNDDQNLPSGNRGERGPRGRYDRRNDGGDGQRRENENSEGKRPFKRKFPLGFKKLEEVLAGEIPENVLTFLNENFDGLLLLLQEPDLSPDYISLILRSVVKIAESYFEPLKVKILHEVIEDNFIKQLINFLTQLHLAEERDKRRAKYFWSNPNEFFSHLNIFCETVIKMIPSEGKAVLPKLIKAAIFVIPYLNLSADILEQYEELQIFVLNEIEKFHKKHEKLIVKKDQNDPEPPEDFREIPVYPEAIEITTPLKPFLRKNIVEGGYKSVEHYLDVQFRLVRNDFVKPLRDGILAYLDPENTKRPQNIKVYNGVKFLKSEICANSADSYLIQLPQPKKVQLKLENSRLFMFGSLVCFTKDYFKTLIFGRIADRKIELLKASQLVVSLHFNTELVDFEGEYLMIESKVYFEPYYHVLTALQQLDEDDFPMKEYIVDTKVDDGVPEYYLENTIQTPGKYKIPIINGVLHNFDWPSMTTLKLNEAQYRAYKNALSRKFSIIQGPPGTGKTHLGLVVGKALLHNHAIWHKKMHPMLVICYTNHALDQFLEGLLTATQQIVRIGGQSKNENINQYNLRQIRHKSHNRLIHEHQFRFRDAANSLKRFYDILNATREFKGIVNVTPLLDKLPETWPVAQLKNLTQQEFKKWLLGGNVQKRHESLNIDDFIAAQNVVQNEYSDSEEDDEEMLQQLIAEEDDVHNIDDDDFNFDCTGAPVYITTLNGYETFLDDLKETAVKLKQKGDKFDPREWFELEKDYVNTNAEYEYLKKALEEIKDRKPQQHIPPDLLQQLRNPDNIDPADRWILYIHWVKMYEKQVIKQMKDAEDTYQKAYREFEAVKEMVDVEMLRSKMVIGMTTTSAARLQSTLKALRSRIVIVEEAAEIMEAHIITSLTRHCEHLILIGDHQQLRPSTADFLMEKKYNLGISLFERMIRNNVECNVLEIQHRMRPEFAKLIVPTIYPVLHNHESVYNFPRVRGVRKNLYFITHANLESREKDDSKLNMFEVEYLIRLAQYLILNGYKPEDVTILCAYSAQLFKMFAERKKFPLLRDIRICVLDNYQGEESKIILLSLVRNNKEKNVGFLKIDNRVCVALSRAREGFYIMGNMEMLTQASQDIWGKIKVTLEKEESLGEALPLSCEIHRNKITYIKSINDFKKVVEGGCDELCNILLSCGHFCKMQCHTRNREHTESNCREKCMKLLCDDEHPCPKKCFEECDLCMVAVSRTLQCGHVGIFACSDRELLCKEIVDVTLSCDHKTRKPCHLPTELVKCPHPCDVRVESCGHVCAQKCHKNNDPDHLEYKCHRTCNKQRPGCITNLDDHRCRKFCYQECDECDIVVKKQRSCGHVYAMKCSVSVELSECPKPCKEKLPCGHPCKQKCSDPCGNCKVIVEKIVIDCGHKIKIPCMETPTKSKCKGKCPLKLPCGHQCQEKCKDPCTTQCKALTKSIHPLLCGHNADIPCSLNRVVEINTNSTLLSYCKEPCNVTLKCNHICKGNCGECYQGRIHKVCSSDCGVPLVCGHVCKTPCRAECPPCNQKCQVRCPHTKCGKRCGEICTPCNEHCTRRCVHQACNNPCEQICSVGPCNRICPLLLKCKHKCIGFCGDPCPPLCRICDNEQVTEIFFGNEDEPNARFVLLEDCQHVIESEGMDEWIKEESKGEITSKGCPKCKTPVINTSRYRDYVKASLRDIMEVKKKFYGDLGENIRIGKEEIRKLDYLCRNSSLQTVCPIVHDLQRLFEDQLKPVKQGKRKMLTKLTVNSTIAKIQILENICNLYQKNFGQVNVFNISPKNQPNNKCINYINFLLNRLNTDPERMTQQEVEDFELELKRLRRIIQLESISHRLSINKRQSPEYRNVEHKIYILKRYNGQYDASIKPLLEALRNSVGILDVSEDELKQIIKVIGVRSGGWYKCPNGHLYAIGECGGAMQEGKCPDCGSKIGGQSHQLTSGNTHSNIDGSRFAAWSEQANMQNYRFDL